jgi:molybdenum cofactor biosynthesis enzyme MoaA
MALILPPVICFRVTRICNARCGFCLAPPDGANPDETTLLRRIEWLFSRGVETIHFCGGEPTIHRSLPRLLTHVHAKGGKTRLTTNGISLSASLISTMASTRTSVKVSLHGNREHHDKIVGRTAYDQTTFNLHRLLARGVSTSVQTTLVMGASYVVDQMVNFCLENRVRRLSFLPFVPRGSGFERRREFELSSSQRDALRAMVKARRRELNQLLDIRWLDFTAHPIHVVEADGRVVLEGATERIDKVLVDIPTSEEQPMPLPSSDASLSAMSLRHTI